MKKIKIIFLSLLVILTMGGCSDWLDVNRNPNALSETDNAEIVIPAAQMNIANALMGWDIGFAGAFYSQYWTQIHIASQYKFLDEYEETDFEDAYNNLIPGALNDLQRIKSISEEGEGEYFLAEVLSIYTWQLITDLWGDIPYSEALGGEEGTFSPKFDTQESIYTNLLQRIDALLAADYSRANLIATYDFIGEGDMDMWMAFAKSLKLKLMLRLSETSAYANASVLAYVQQGGFLSSNAEIPGAVWEARDSKQHPMVEFNTGAAGYISGNVIASRTMIEYLFVNADPRIDALYDAPSSGTHKGSFQGDFAADNSVDSDGNGTPDAEEEYSTVSFPTATPLPFMTDWEILFNIAEVYARANMNAEAKTAYDAGVAASFAYWGLSGSITGAGEYAEWPGGTLEENIEQISLQRWIAFCKTQHAEAWLSRNRTKYPAVDPIDIASDRSFAHTNFPVGNLTLSVAGRSRLSDRLPASPIYPNSVITRNTTKPSQKTSMAEKVWWDQKAGI
ncbi:MAG: SusD/RagB family nutrient-binding outer membrane lipoprotein [Bacteroidetes bacterium]|nr:SusD/RagB family nutrient-binding outer membrane lipoprotein [Bacteroidota bacterium]